MSVKWDGNKIISFLNVYEKYDILWNIKLKDHMNKSRRDTAFERLLKELQESGFENIDMNILKTKIKTIKTVYRQEVNKIVKSKKSGSGTDDLYKPKLMWFARADSFLQSMVINRETTNNMVSKNKLYYKPIILFCHGTAPSPKKKSAYLSRKEFAACEWLLIPRCLTDCSA